MSDSSGPSAYHRFLGAGIGAATAEFSTLPIDIAKVRLQTQVPLADGSMKYRNMIQAIGVIAKEQGPVSLWNGIAPALVRQVSYTSMSFVLYTPIRDMIAGEGVAKEDIPFAKRVLSGGLAGGISIICANPTDVVKTQMQTATNKPSMMGIARSIYANGGVKALWRGVTPNVARCFIGNACEIGCYDQFKTWITASGALGDGPMSHFAASGGAGVVSAIFSTPVDVVKTRLMAQAGGAASDGLPRYTGVLDAFMRIPKNEGLGALYKGFGPLAARKILWTVVYFMAYEKALFMVSGKYS